jgi:drug/metabolite transporter (DMT)-like permease
MSTRAWMIFAAVSTLWGIPYLFIKIAVDGGITPGVLAWGRIVLGAAVLLALAARAGVLAQLRGRWRWLAAYAIVEVSIPFPLIATGEQHVSSSLAAIIIASVPLIVALLALRFDPAERASGSRLVGLVIGVLGVVLLVGIERGRSWSPRLATRPAR